MTRLLLASLILPLFVIAAGRPISPPAFQSPIETPTAPSSPLATQAPPDDSGPAPSEAAIPPLLWIAAGFVLGVAIVLLVRRTSSHDG